jgi:hypothetical protein
MVHIGSHDASQQKNADPRPLTASVDIDASPDEVWRVISDVRRTPEWSTECRRVVARRAVRTGSLLVGLNRRKAVVWATLSRITDLEFGSMISWVVLTNRSLWTYRITAADGGTRLTETRETPRGETRFALWFTRALLGGQGVHDDELEGAMASGLQVIKAAVEERS